MFAAQDWWFVLLFIATVTIIGCAIFAYAFEVYRIFPDWGPIRKYDNDGNEDLRINQLLIHRSADCAPDPELKKEEAMDPLKNQLSQYGSLQPNLNDPQQQTWGIIKAPWERREVTFDPNFGKVTIRHAFCDTQYLRSHSAWWARDEPHFMREAHIHEQQPLTINDDRSADMVRQRMTLDGGPSAPSILNIAA